MLTSLVQLSSLIEEPKIELFSDIASFCKEFDVLPVSNA